MAGYETPREIAAAWIEDRAPRVRLATMSASTSLYSYRLPIATRENGTILLADGYGSMTTARHIRATAMELAAHGYAPTDELTTINRPSSRLDPAPQTYRVWIKVASPTFDRVSNVYPGWRFAAYGAINLTP